MGYLLSFLAGCGVTYFGSEAVAKNIQSINYNMEMILQNEALLKAKFVELFREAEAQGRLPELIAELQKEGQKIAMTLQNA
jgi:hypothetical protein